MVTFPSVNQAHASTARVPLLTRDAIIMPSYSQANRIPAMTQKQAQQRLRPVLQYLEQVPELSPDDTDPIIGTEEPDPVPTDSFPTSDTY
jgi:hypothetical protein